MNIRARIQWLKGFYNSFTLQCSVKIHPWYCNCTVPTCTRHAKEIYGNIWYEKTLKILPRLVGPCHYWNTSMSLNQQISYCSINYCTQSVPCNLNSCFHPTVSSLFHFCTTASRCEVEPRMAYAIQVHLHFPLPLFHIVKFTSSSSAVGVSFSHLACVLSPSYSCKACIQRTLQKWTKNNITYMFDSSKFKQHKSVICKIVAGMLNEYFKYPANGFTKITLKI